MDWIPCAERLPELKLVEDGSMYESDDVLIYGFQTYTSASPEPFMAVAHLEQYHPRDKKMWQWEENWIDPDARPDETRVTHWRPLPAAP